MRYFIHSIRWFLPVLLLLVLPSCKPGVSEPATAERTSTPLIDYVLADDPAFDYQVVYTKKGENYTYYVMRMTSQHWLTPEQVNETEWWHWVTLVVPDDYTYSTAMKWIVGGSNTDAIRADIN